MSEIKYHKHRGISSGGKLKSHPIHVKHSNKQVQQWHDDEVGNVPNINSTTTTNKSINKRTIVVNVDGDDYLSINLDKLEHAGIRVTFSRLQGRTRKTFGVQLDK